jgi:hypothetical protein
LIKTEFLNQTNKYYNHKTNSFSFSSC